MIMCLAETNIWNGKTFIRDYLENPFYSIREQKISKESINIISKQRTLNNFSEFLRVIQVTDLAKATNYLVKKGEQDFKFTN